MRDILNYSSGLKIVPRSLEGKEKTHSEPGRCVRQDGGNMGAKVRETGKGVLPCLPATHGSWKEAKKTPEKKVSLLPSS